ncbi:phytase [Anabaena azotica]|uniref:phytase n=1 Tax=Anabaena azotica TaxID=197653 RepID=UPI0039A4DFE1
MTNLIQLNNLDTVSLNGAEISDFDPKSKRLFITGALDGKPLLQVVDASDPENLNKNSDIDLSEFGAGIQSVAVRKGIGNANSIVAVAISANTLTDPGKVVFFDAVTLTKIAEVTVGALPDMLTFTPDGSKLLVANEGEPSEDYSIDPEGSISIIDVSGDITSLDNSKVITADFTAFNSQIDALKAEGVRIFGLNASVAQDFEPEYIAVSADNQTAFITLQENNAIAVLNIASGTITDILPLGYKDHNLSGNGIDASDRDNGINIRNWPVLGMYLPDGISSFKVGNNTYYITANEGDARIRPTDDNILPVPNDEEGDIFNEETRVKDVILDPTAFPDAAELQKDENLGRLIITNTMGDTDGDGDFDQLYAYGGRSFSIWNDQGQLVYDSGDKIEQILAQLTPDLFNANNASPDDVDTRSDNKGPEPESVVVGVINNVPFAFVGLERAGGGVMVYNLSDPTAPAFVQYIRTEGDISPEGLKFISAEDSPNAKPMLAVSNEVSSTVSLYEIIPSAASTVETTPVLLDDDTLPDDQQADADDPAIYVNATNSANSLVLTSVKNGGLRVYDLSGELLQTVNPGGIRYNNIDLQYGFELGDQKIDFAVASDRNNDKLAIFKINPNANDDNYLEDITDSSIGTLFQALPFDPPYEPSSRSAYGLALYRSPFTNDYYVFTSRRQTGDIAQFKLIDMGNGKIGAERVREFTIPTDDGIDPQTEGMVVDQETGFLYIGQENVGIWKFDAEPNSSNTGKLIDKVKDLGGSNLVDDVEGLTIYYGANGTGYLLVSSQGDNTFAAYTREGNNEFLGRFAIGSNGDIDSVQESDGADVINVPLGANFPNGLFVTQDGNNDPAVLVEDDGEIENISSNFKFVPWENIVDTLPDILKIDTTSYDPRNPVLQPRLTNYEFTNLPKLGTTSTGQDIFLGGFSGLYFQGTALNGNLKFVTHTDRGPNGEPTGQNRPFLLPDFQPEIVSFELNQQTGEITITNRTGLFRADGTTPLTGLPNVQAATGGTAYTDEIGVDLNGNVLANDPFGADVEGIVVDENGHYWMVDEYRPAIYHFDVNGKLLDRFIPQGTATATDPDQPAGNFGTEVLPAVYAQRRANRGFEAVALEGNKLYAFIQSAIDNPDNSGDTTSRNSRNLRILEFDIVSKQVTGEYLYLLDDITGSGTAKTDKIGDAVSLGNGKFAVVERDDRSDNTANKLIYQIDLTGATNIHYSGNFNLPADKTIEQLTPAELTAAGITSVSKSLIANAAQLGYTGVEKLEGLALVSPNTLALINDNDFNVAGTNTPEKLGILELPKNLVAIYGTPGNDELFANFGDTLIGGLGEDSLYAEGIAGNNYLDGGEDNDSLFVVEGNNNTLKGGAGDDLLSVVEGNNNTLEGDDGADKLYIIEGSFNTLKGGIGNDYLKTSSVTGNNTLEGGEGDDILIGILASDRLFGENGNDFLYAGQQGTQMTGGAGSDRFYLGNGSVPNVPGEVLDFTKGDDKVIIAGIPAVNSFDDLILEQVGTDTFIKALIDGSQKELGILRNVNKNTLTADDFGFIIPVFSITDASAAEGNAITFTITRTDDILADQTITVTTSIATGNTASVSDFTAKTQELIFAQGETQKTFTVQTTEDALFEGDETFTVTLSNPTNGSIISSTNTTAKGTITNDDLAPVFSIVAAEATEGSGVTFTVTRTGDAQANQAITVTTSIATGDTASVSDFTAKTQELIFAQGETQKTFTVQTTEDALFEGNETFTVTLSNPTNGAIIDDTKDTVQGTITNNDPVPVFAIASAQALEGSTITFTITRTGDAQANQSVTVITSIATGDTASAIDFTTKTQTFTFATGETQKTFTVDTTQDTVVEANETFTISLSNATDGAVISSTNGTAKGTITDDDTPAEFTIAAASATEGNALTFTVTRSRDNLTPQNVTVTTSIATGDTASVSDFTAKTQTLTFAAGETQKTFTVQTKEDTVVEANETFTVTLSNATNGAVISSTNGTAKGTINDDDIASVFNISAASATEGNALTFTVTRTGNSQTQQKVTVSTAINANDTASNNDFTRKTENLTFAVGETQKTFTVQTKQDFRVEANETFTVNLSNAKNGATISSTNGTAKGTINDEDIALAVITNNNIFTIKGIGDTVRLKATLIDSNSSVVNELGVFAVDDAQGRIKGIAPGEQGYNEAALQRAKSQSKTIFSAIANLPNGFETEINSDSLTRLLGFNSGSHLKFFLVKEGTVDSFRAGKIASTNIIFADTSTQRITKDDDSFTISWKESSTTTEFNSLVVKIESTDESSTIGTALQGSNQSEVVDFRDISGKVKAEFSVYREAAFNNEVYFYKVDNAQGLIGSVEATATNRVNYLQAAINNIIKDADTGERIKFAVANQGLFTDNAVIAGGSILAPMIIINGTLSQLTDNNTANDPQVYFPYLGVNSDQVDHIRLLGDNTFGFEDLPNGGDLDYNDVIIRFDFAIA